VKSVKSQPIFRKNMSPPSSGLAYSEILEVDATCSFQTPVDFQRTIRRYIPEDMTLYNRRCGNFNSYSGLSVFYFMAVLSKTQVFIKIKM
jgi:hypothetical protein